MTSQEFVDALQAVTKKDAVDGVLALLENPPGRRPRPELMAASRWYKGLDESAQAMVGRLVAMSARQALFGVFAVLDGARAIEPQGEKGSFTLVMRKQGQESLIAGPDAPPLHELLTTE